MKRRHLGSKALLACLLAGTGVAAGANTAELNALSLESSPEAPAATGTPSRLFLELAAGSLQRRPGDSSTGTWRASVDWFVSHKLSADFRLVASNRLDAFDPEDINGKRVVNSLREAFLTWVPGEAGWAVDAGRINLRLGPAVGYNPTDFFRDQTLRTLPTIDPVTLREMRLGSAMVRLQRLHGGGSVSLALSPKLASAADNDSFSLDLGSTNQSNRFLLSTANKWTDRLNTQLHLFKREGESAKIGASASALASDSVVLFGEWVGSKEKSALGRLTGGNDLVSGHRAAVGLTYTTGSNLSLTVEGQLNTHAVSKNEWDQLALAGLPLRLAYVADAVRRQDLVPRRAILVYGSQRDLAGIKKLNLTGFVQTNLQDRSRLYWIELRQQWQTVELAAQYQRTSGKEGSEFTFAERHKWAQVLVTYRF